MNVLPKQRDSAEVNHGFHGQRAKLRCSKAVPVNKPFLALYSKPFVCLKLRNSDQHQNFRPLWALSLSSMALTITKYFQGANNSAPDWPLVCPSAQFLHVRLHFIHTLSLAGITSEPCAGVFQWAHITASQKIDRTCCIYILLCAWMCHDVLNILELDIEATWSMS